MNQAACGVQKEKTSHSLASGQACRGRMSIGTSAATISAAAPKLASPAPTAMAYRKQNVGGLSLDAHGHPLRHYHCRRAKACQPRADDDGLKGPIRDHQRRCLAIFMAHVSYMHQRRHKEGRRAETRQPRADGNGLQGVLHVKETFCCVSTGVHGHAPPRQSSLASRPAIACKCELQWLTANPLQFGTCFYGLQHWPLLCHLLRRHSRSALHRQHWPAEKEQLMCITVHVCEHQHRHEKRHCAQVGE